MKKYNLYAKVTGQDVDFELKRKVDSLSVLEKIAGVCIEDNGDSDGLKPALTAEEAYKHLEQSKSYRWFRKHYNCTKQQLSGYRRWLGRKKKKAKKSSEAPKTELTGMELYARVTGRGACIELKGKVESLDSVLQQIVVSGKSDMSEEESTSSKPALTYKNYLKYVGNHNYSWFAEHYDVTKKQFNGFRLAKQTTGKPKLSKSKGKKSKSKPKLTREIGYKFLKRGKDYDWLKERYECTPHQVAAYKAWISMRKHKT